MCPICFKPTCKFETIFLIGGKILVIGALKLLFLSDTLIIVIIHKTR